MYSISTTGFCFADVNSVCKGDYGITYANTLTTAGGILAVGSIQTQGAYIDITNGGSTPVFLAEGGTAGLLSVGSTAGGVDGTIKGAVYVSASTKPTFTFAGGTCAGGTPTGGATSGTATLTGACAATNTLTLSAMPTVPNSVWLSR